MIKNKNIFAFLLASMLLFGSVVFADTSESHGASIDTILSGIRSELNIGSNDRIEPDKVSDASLEKLGEAVMSFQIPDPRQHEWMDKMIGGEGSQSLSNMHKLLGYRYLANGSTDFGSLMMGSGSFDSGKMYGRGFREGRFGGFMPFYGFRGYMGWIVPVLIGLLILAAAVLLVYLVKRNRKYVTGSNDPLSALKVRYARGDIGRQEYLTMKDELSRQ